MVKSSRGEEKVIANDIFRERVTLRGTDGELRTIPLGTLRDEMTAAGDPLSGTLTAAARDTGPLAAADYLDEPIDLDAVVTEERPVPIRVPSSGRSAAAPRPPRTASPVTPAAPARPARREETATPAVAPRVEGPAPTATGPEGEKRTQRRRGRRGGRRNRPGGGGAPPAASGPAGAGGDVPDGE